MSWVWLIHHWNEHWTITISGWADKKPISTDDTDRQRGENFGEKTNRANAVLGQVHACEAAAAAILLPSRLLNVVWTWSRTGKLLVSRFQARCAIFYLITFPLFPAGHHLPCLAAKSSTSDTLLTLLWSSIHKEKYVVYHYCIIVLKYHFSRGPLVLPLIGPPARPSGRISPPSSPPSPPSLPVTPVTPVIHVKPVTHVTPFRIQIQSSGPF